MKLTLFFILISVASYAQVFESNLRSVFYAHKVELVPCEDASLFTEGVINLYVALGEPAMDALLKEYDRKLYKGVDLYMGESEESVVESMKKDSFSSFKETKKATLCVEQRGDIYLVMVYSYR